MNQKDRLLKVGQKLEKQGLAAFKTTTPSGTPAYYRAQGLQIIPSEADELDTNKACQVVITKEAAALSGLIMAVLRILGQGEDGARRSKAAIAQFKTLLASKGLNGWEAEAAKDIVSAGLGFADKPFPAPVRSDGWGDFEGFGEHIMRQYIHRRRPKDANAADEHGISGNELGHPLMGHEENAPAGAADNSHGEWSQIRGVVGIALDKHWIPVSFPTLEISHKEEQAILRAIVRRGLKPEIAMTIIANRAKDLKRRSR